MASTIFPIQTVGIRAFASSGHRKSEVNNRRSSSSSANWWSPLFGWSAEPDYIDADNKRNDLSSSPSNSKRAEPDQDQDQDQLTRSRFAPGSFTAEKAKQLRMMTTEASTFHDVMYHSAIASRLASDFSGHSDR
ncbi:hypothetical protein ACH5RR_005902 [Cinchona calisaya]|uniref:Uncharacterized protein n=1 Tax=Cinchona calisaya TaxID=153742 RepID=A0ABD3AMG6_9GENT